MARRTGNHFPALSGQGLMAVNVKGDGNCFFRAISDQLHGHENRHENIRSRVINYMREHENEFKSSLEVGGGRKYTARRGTAPRGTINLHTTSEIDNNWRKHLSRMARPGTYAEDQEVLACARAYNMDILVHRSNPAHNNHFWGGDDTAPRKIAHVALAHEHYQSVRNINGPHSGAANTLPNGEDSYEVRMAKYQAKSGSSSPSDNSTGEPSGSTSPASSVTPAPPTNRQDPGLAFMSAWSDESDSEDDKRPAKKPFNKPVQTSVNRPLSGSNRQIPTPAPAKRPSPIPDPGLAFLDDFSDSSDSEDDKKPVPTPVLTPAKKRKRED